MYRNIQIKKLLSQLIKYTNLFCEDFVYPHSGGSTTPGSHQDIDVTNMRQDLNTSSMNTY